MGEPLRVISLGAGVQSTTLVLMAAHGEIGPMPNHAIFADTGAEPSPVYDHLRWLMSDNVLPFPVHVVSAGSLKAELLGERTWKNGNDGRPPFFVDNGRGNVGPLQRQCTRHYKLDPLRRKTRELAGLKTGAKSKGAVVEQWIGISLDEAIRMKPSRDAFCVNRWPLVEQRMSRWDCLNWLDRHGYPRPPKSACTFCPYRSDAEWRRMREEDAPSFAEACLVDSTIRNSMPRVRTGKCFVHRSLKPLAEVDLRSHAELGQPDLFNNECEGMCGV